MSAGVSATAGGGQALERGDVRESDRAGLRRFGLIVGGAFALLGLLLLWRGRPLAPWLLGIAGALVLAGLVAPGLLAPVERLWLKLAYVLSVVMTHVILTLAFYLVITPLGFIMRLLRRDPLGTRFEPARESYWDPVDPDGPTSRPDRPF